VAGRRRAPGKRRAGRRIAGTGPAAQWSPAIAASRLDQLPFLFVIFGTAAGVGTIGLGAGYVRSGTLVLSGVLLIAAVARLALPDRRAGMLSSRRRSLDVAIYAALGLALLAAGLLAPAAS
jgi:hypothetical protein